MLNLVKMVKNWTKRQKVLHSTPAFIFCGLHFTQISTTERLKKVKRDKRAWSVSKAWLQCVASYCIMNGSSYVLSFKRFCCRTELGVAYIEVSAK